METIPTLESMAARALLREWQRILHNQGCRIVQTCIQQRYWHICLNCRCLCFHYRRTICFRFHRGPSEQQRPSLLGCLAGCLLLLLLHLEQPLRVAIRLHIREQGTRMPQTHAGLWCVSEIL